MHYINSFLILLLIKMEYQLFLVLNTDTEKHIIYSYPHA